MRDQQERRPVVAFDREPSLGTMMWLDDQSYELIDAQPYTRKSDGQPSRLLLWETTCPVEGCGQSFRLTTGMRISAFTRRCEAHRGGLRPVKGKRGRKLKVRVELP